MNDVEISIVVPVRNEEGQLVRFVDAISGILHDIAFELLFIDDGSTDETWAEVRKLNAANANIGGLRLSRNFGKEAAVWSGIEIARGAAVLVMDVDLQHPPALIPQMIELWRSGRWKIVEARARRHRRAPFWYRWSSRFFYSILEWGTGFDLAGATDFKLLDRSVVDVLKALPERVTFFRGISAWTGLERTTIDFDVPDAGRRTRWKVMRLARLGVDAITSFTPWPLYVVAMAGVIFAIFAVLLGIQTLYNYFSGRAVTGFTTVILLVLIVGAIIMLALGVLGLYVSRLFEEVKGRPRSIAVEAISPAARRETEGSLDA